VAKESLTFHVGPPCPTLLRPVGGPSLKRPYGRVTGSPPAGHAACACLLPLWTPHAVRLSRVFSLRGLGASCLQSRAKIHFRGSHQDTTEAERKKQSKYAQRKPEDGGKGRKQADE
jgi:hypothetical protein